MERLILGHVGTIAGTALGDVAEDILIMGHVDTSARWHDGRHNRVKKGDWDGVESTLVIAQAEVSISLLVLPLSRLWYRPWLFLGFGTNQGLYLSRLFFCLTTSLSYPAAFRFGSLASSVSQLLSLSFFLTGSLHIIVPHGFPLASSV